MTIPITRFSSRFAVLWAAGLLALCAAGLAVWLAERAAPENRTYKIGWEVDPPEQMRGSHGEPSGFAVDLVNEAAQRRAIRLEWVYRAESSEAALRSGQVDLWPVITATPERKRFLHISSPFMESTHCLLVRGDNPARQLNDLAEARIGYSGLPINLHFLMRDLPKAQPVVRPSGELIQGLCTKEIEGAFIEEHSAVNALLGGKGCPGQALRIISTNAPPLELGVGSTFQAAAAADALRDEIGKMADEGLLNPLLAKWGFLTGRRAESIQALVNERQRERWLIGLVVLFASLLLVAAWQARRATQASRQARRSALHLRESERRFRELFENIGLLAVMTDRRGRITFANRFALETTGWTRDEVIGQDQFHFYPPEYHEKLAAAIETAQAATATVTLLEAPIRTRDGKTRWIQWHATNLREASGNVIGLASLGVDLTAHRALQDQYLQVQKLDSIGRLAGGVAHDFNNLLTVINGYSDLLMARVDAKDRSRSFVEQIRKAGERAAGLTRQLLAFSRKQVTHPRPFDLNAMVTESEQMLRRVLAESIEMIAIPAPAAAWVMADPDQIHQVLMNLVVNARDAMPQGGRLTVRVDPDEPEKRELAERPGAGRGLYVVLSVTDTGTGMDQQTQEHIFEPFFTTKKEGQGTGLGLSTVYGIVKQSGGRIEVESEVGHGSCFRVYLPRTLVLPVAEPVGEPDRNPRRGTGTVMIAEDQLEVRRFAQEVLESRGYRVLTAASGSEALSVAGNYAEPIDLLLADMVMPGMSGRELAHALHARRPGLPVILTSAYARELTVQPGMPEDSFAYLPKPFSADALAAAVRDLIGTDKGD